MCFRLASELNIYKFGIENISGSHLKKKQLWDEITSKESFLFSSN